MGCTVVTRPRYVAQTLPYGEQTFDCNNSSNSECQDLFRQFKSAQHI